MWSETERGGWRLIATDECIDVTPVVGACQVAMLVAMLVIIRRLMLVDIETRQVLAPNTSEAIILVSRAAREKRIEDERGFRGLR